MGCKSSKDGSAPSPDKSASILSEATAQEKALAQLKVMFDRIDASGVGSVCKMELTSALEKDQNLGGLIKEAGFNEKFNVLDPLNTSSDGRVTWDEFHSNLKTAVVEVKEAGNMEAVAIDANETVLKQLKAIFESIDANDEGSVCKTELASALEKDLHNLGGLIKEAGLNDKFNVLEQLHTNADGRITWDEFHSNSKKAVLAEVEEAGNAESVERLADEKALKQLKAIFESIGSNAEGAVSRDELAARLKKEDGLGKLIEDARFNPDFCVFDQLDSSHGSRIVWDEFEAHVRTAAKNEVNNDGDAEVAVVLEDRTQAEGPVGRKGWCC